ncbi:MAG: hypothetical protein KDB69_02220, partial [Acidimicrobiia bacterium]|nr:hypothetical protein [Acidimicrobiia bacterium]
TLITLFYVTMVVGTGLLVGSRDETSPIVSVVAIALVAIVAQPLRRRLQVIADRIVYGRRATPYQVLSDFARNVAAADQSLLDEVARSLIDGTSAVGATIWVGQADDRRPAAVWPEGHEEDPDAPVLFHEVVHGGETLGAIGLEYPRGQELSLADEHLVEQIASGIGLALRNLQLTDDLKRRVADITESRRRMVSVQDETRRRLERDLHDGAQQHLVAIKVKLGLMRNLAEAGNAPKTTELIGSLVTEADEAIQAMRDFARGVYPPLLEAEGLGPAIVAQARKLPLPVEVETGELRRYTTEVESSVYFCVLESLQNAVKHAKASRLSVELRDSGATLGFVVADDGVGFSDSSHGSGLVNLADRIDSIGGRLEVVSAPGAGTTVRADIPVEVPVA